MEQLQRKDLFRQQCFVNGQWQDADSGQTLQVQNPATGQTLGHVPRMGADETRRAIESARQAWAGWRAKTAQQRSVILRRWFELMMAHQDDLATLMTLEQGKPLAEAKGEIAYAASYFEWYAEEGKRAYGDVIPAASGAQRIVVVKEPIGVCAAITPWNFPSSMITRKAGAALAAGCPIVVKPASQTPYSALALAVLAQEAGVPDGVFSVITGSAAAIGGEMTSNPDVRKVSFTGSTEVGRTLMAQSADQIKKVSLELGGNAPFIVFEDADLDAAVEGAMASKYRNMGQTCVCTNRFYVHDSVYDAFAQKLVAAVEKLKVGNGLEAGVTQGPLIDEAAVAKVSEHVADAVQRGGRILTGGKQPEQGGQYYLPTVVADANTDMLVAQEETFGPMAPLFRFSSDQDVIAQANDTIFGLAAYFYSRDIGRVWRVAEALEYGMVGINTGLISNAAAPFGGVKQSGMGREGSFYGLDDYMVVKYLCMGGV
ncbi:NADP-dependent succinate-semialdehyde dehydrogenase [Alcaligenes aquatilis]|uniref:NADP-dependent succinate-semialdehyde dehydrogenase I n=1 Tax=Alcaligenes aquatilis TaxID=323284 RepID=A0A3G2HYI0_9BURK|nr:NADP-dependent succinate-semialdehyde dehydrogenase [Alcaligenes aquatilis]AYN22206.1 NADP-dependent succinate-semialdehyde dehydrogenase I [Alcaligenes aquatilis]